MTNKVYKTAQGKMIDMGALSLRQDQTRAVGNMSVNARGETIDSQNQKIESRNSKINKSYAKQSRGNVTDEPVVDRSKVLEEDPLGPMDEPVVQTDENKDDGFSLT